LFCAKDATAAGMPPMIRYFLNIADLTTKRAFPR
jgi:hypothetical protein